MNPSVSLSGPLPPKWTKRQLLVLIWPLIIDQLLIVLMGIIDTFMVASLGEEAVGGVSLVDSINVVLLQAFSFLAAGGAVVCSQFLGKRDNKSASNAARQLVYAVTFLSGLLSAGMLPARSVMLHLIYGHIEQGIMIQAEQYFLFTALSYPFIALSTAGSALYRSMGNSRMGMWISFLVNILNVMGNAFFIFVCGWGVAGAALSTLLSRFVAAVIILALLYCSRKTPLGLRGIFRVHVDGTLIRRILKVGVPNGIEGAIFQVGKLVLSRLVSTFGTAAIAGYAVSNIIMTIGNLPGLAVAAAMLPVVGQCAGAGDNSAAAYYTKRLILFSYAITGILNLAFILFMPVFFGFFTLSPESLRIARLGGLIFCTAAIFIWNFAYCLPYALRAAGDAGYTMLVSTLAMWLVRVGFAHILARFFGLGVICVWISMVCEWLTRGSLFLLRWKSGKWKEKRLV
ncbi:MAG: MATE family efflux transporter [Spirochaetaceae bacterium]|nr:MATE family efflux transporter [Spirochaetaceae bacterium]